MSPKSEGSHAFLVLAHEDDQMLHRLVNRMSPLGTVYIHIDLKTNTSKWHLDDLPCKLIAKRIRVFWGDWSSVEATVLLLEMALADTSNSRFTLLTGSNYPIISNETLSTKALSLGNIIGSRPAPNMPDGSRPEIDYERRFYKTRKPNGTWSRVKNGVMNRIVFSRRPLNWKAVTPESGMRAGEQCWSIDREFAQYCVNQIRSSSPLINYFKRIVCSDEKVFATLYGEYSGQISAEGITFTKWMKKPHLRGHFPAPLSREDIEEGIAMNTYWFARKFRSTDSAILDWLDGL
jgi:hypothetical protein